MSQANVPNAPNPPPVVVAQAQAEPDNTITRLQVWKGNGKDATTVELWIDQVERMATQKGWNNQRTAAAVCDALKDTAARWMAVTKANPNKSAMLTDWEQLKPAIKKRFADALTATQKQAFVRGLVQPLTKQCRTFTTE